MFQDEATNAPRLSCLIISAIVLPDAWKDRVLDQFHLADDVRRVETERQRVSEQLRRLGKTYRELLIYDDEFQRQTRLLKDRLNSLVVPDAQAAVTAGKLIEHRPPLWEKADLGERRRILMTMRDTVYVDTVEEKRIVAIRPKPAFRPLFEIANTREGSGIVLVHESEGEPVTANQPHPMGSRLMALRVCGGDGGGSLSQNEVQ